MGSEAQFRGVAHHIDVGTSDHRIHFGLASLWDLTVDNATYAVTINDARELRSGGPYLIVCRGPQSIDVEDRTGTVLYTLDADRALLIWLMDRTTEEGDWVLKELSATAVEQNPATAMPYVFGGGSEYPTNPSTTDMRRTRQFNHNTQAWSEGTASYVTHAFGSASWNMGQNAGLAHRNQSGSGFGDYLDHRYYSAVDDSWTQVTDLPYDVLTTASSAAVRVKDGTMTYGLFSRDGATPETTVYDPTDDSYSDGTNPATGQVRGATFTPDDDGHVLGGGTTIANNTNNAYTKSTDNWEAKQVLPTDSRSRAASSAAGSLGFITGGWNNSQTKLSRHDEYDPTSDAWTSRTAHYQIRWICGGAGVGTQHFVFGGLNSGNQEQDTAQVWDTSTTSWSSQQAAPTDFLWISQLCQPVFA